MKYVIFKYYCNFTACVMNRIHVLPSTVVSRGLGISLYKTRKYIKELVADGLLKSDIVVDNYDDDYPPILVRGYCLTKKGFETEEYKNAWEKELELLKRC